MLGEIAKNFWLLLTVVIPGLFTYGLWRLLLLLEPSKGLDSDTLMQIDDSVVVTASIIIAIALLQQSVAITIEALLAYIANNQKKRWPNFYSLLCERFELSASGKLDKNATRVIGNFFLSINMCVGLSLLLIYFLAYDGLNNDHWIPVSLMVLLAVTLLTTIFRGVNAKWVIEACKKQSS